jgi:hypothetical protein
MGAEETESGVSLTLVVVLLVVTVAVCYFVGKGKLAGNTPEVTSGSVEHTGVVKPPTTRPVNSTPTSRKKTDPGSKPDSPPSEPRAVTEVDAAEVKKRLFDAIACDAVLLTKTGKNKRGRHCHLMPASPILLWFICFYISLMFLI